MSICVNIKKTFGDFVLNVAFQAENEIMALLGASGCGKSMTLKCIAGVVRPDEGRIVVDDVVLFDSEKGINLSPQRRRVGLLFQNYALFPNMTVERNIMSVLSLGKKRGDERKRFASLADRFYISGLENHYPAQLSGGQQQRVALARIMASDPSIIMLDEPLSALDSYLRWRLEDELIRILEEFGGTTLYVSHNRDEVYRLCRKVCVVSGGLSEEVCTVDELFRSPRSLASALLSGCKNYSRVWRRGVRTVHATDWNVDLSCGEDVADDVRYAGVRSHYIALARGRAGENVFTCRVLRVSEDVFSTALNLLPERTESRHDFSRIRMDLSKEDAAGIAPGDVVSIRIEPKDILLLKS